MLKILNKKTNILHGRNNQKSAFTLIEIVLVILVIGILGGVSIQGIRNYNKNQKLEESMKYVEEVYNDIQYCVDGIMKGEYIDNKKTNHIGGNGSGYNPFRIQGTNTHTEIDIIFSQKDENRPNRTITYKNPILLGNISGQLLSNKEIINITSTGIQNTGTINFWDCNLDAGKKLAQINFYSDIDKVELKRCIESGSNCNFLITCGD